MILMKRHMISSLSSNEGKDSGNKADQKQPLIGEDDQCRGELPLALDVI